MVATGELAICATLVHVHEMLLHLLCWKHGELLKTKGFTDIFLYVLVEFLSGRSFENNSCPVHVYLRARDQHDARAGDLAICSLRTASLLRAGIEAVA